MTPSLLLTNARLVLEDRLARGSVAVAGDRIVATIPEGAPLPAAGRVVDLGGAYLAPGFVDLHIHGAAGVDVMEADEGELRRLAGWLAVQGTTRFVPTLVPVEVGAYDEVVARLARWIGRALLEPPEGAVPVGVHFEGPFVNARRCGALHADRFLTGGDRERFYESVGLERLDGLPARLITLAPEVDGGIDLVRACVGHGFRVSIGHTEAAAETLDEALGAGARHMTHFMNAMPQLHHRAPGPVGWGLLRDRVSIDLIADFEHLDPEVVRLLVRAKARRAALISDAVPPAGLGDGGFSVWGERIEVRGLRTSNASGAIAGSVIALRDAVRNVVSLGVSIVEAVRMASLVPARVLGLEAFGALAPGKVADCVAFHDEIEPFLTVVAGRVVYEVGA